MDVVRIKLFALSLQGTDDAPAPAAPTTTTTDKLAAVATPAPPVGDIAVGTKLAEIVPPVAPPAKAADPVDLEDEKPKATEYPSGMASDYDGGMIWPAVRFLIMVGIVGGILYALGAGRLVRRFIGGRRAVRYGRVDDEEK